MPQVFKIGSYWVYFGSNETILWNLSMSMLRKVLQLPMQPKYGLLPLGAATCATTIPTFPHIRFGTL